MTVNLLTGRSGPQLLPRAFTVDSHQALASLDRVAGLPGSILLPGHGEPWRGSLAEAAARAREAGVASHHSGGLVGVAQRAPRGRQDGFMHPLAGRRGRAGGTLEWR